MGDSKPHPVILNMKTINTTVNLRPIRVQQFESLSEAMSILPAELLLKWINICYNNVQCVAFVDALREASRGK